MLKTIPHEACRQVHFLGRHVFRKACPLNLTATLAGLDPVELTDPKDFHHILGFQLAAIGGRAAPPPPSDARTTLLFSRIVMVPAPSRSVAVRFRTRRSFDPRIYSVQPSFRLTSS